MSDPNVTFEPVTVHAPYIRRKRGRLVDITWGLTNDTVAAIKRVNVKSSFRLDFDAPEAGDYNYKLYLVCDAYLGCDQEYDVQICKSRRWSRLKTFTLLFAKGAFEFLNTQECHHVCLKTPVCTANDTCACPKLSTLRY